MSRPYFKFYPDNGTLQADADHDMDADTFTETGYHLHMRFVFSVDERAQTVTNFQVDGNTNDIGILLHAELANVVALLQNTTMSGRNAVTHDPTNNATLS